MQQINASRLWDSLNQMATLGAIPGNGVCRLALSEEDRQARDLLQRWATDAGCTVRVDEMGNMFLRREGRQPQLAQVLTGSHVDSQPNGGRYDGIYGVLAGLEVLRSLNDARVETERAVEVVNWTNEEGARFAPAMLASGVFSGVFTRDEAWQREDARGISVKQALRDIGYLGNHPARAFPIHAAYELHIEQGPILEAEGKTIGVVRGAQGQRWYQAEVVGFSAHAGTTPLPLRRDALLGFASLVQTVNQIGLHFAPDARATVGRADIEPNSPNVVPGRVRFSIEFRHPDEQVLAEMEAALLLAFAQSNDGPLTASVERIFDYAPVEFDAHCVATVRQAATTLGYAQREMISGAGHDACYLSRVAPTAMIFIPCVDGISHNPAENISETWASAGANVLLNAVMSSAMEG